jgi:hypothetical protein
MFDQQEKKLGLDHLEHHNLDHEGLDLYQHHEHKELGLVMDMDLNPVALDLYLVYLVLVLVNPALSEGKKGIG